MCVCVRVCVYVCLDVHVCVCVCVCVRLRNVGHARIRTTCRHPPSVRINPITLNFFKLGKISLI